MEVMLGSLTLEWGGGHTGPWPPPVAAGCCGTAAGGLPRLHTWESHPNSLQNTNTLHNTQPNPPSTAATIQVGYRAGTHLSPPPCQVRGVCCQRGHKSGQILHQEPQTLVTSLVWERWRVGSLQPSKAS